MEQKEIIEGNKLIAEFMKAGRIRLSDGVRFTPAYTFEYPLPHGRRQSATTWWQPTDLAYDVSWDWLMPVVDKMEQMHYWVRICLQDCEVTDMNNADYPVIANETKCDSKIEAVWRAVVAFIKWHNANNPTL